MEKNEIIKATNEVKLPSELTLKFKDQHDLAVLQDALMTEEDIFPFDAFIKVAFASILKDLWMKLSIKALAEKKSYKIKLKAHDQVVVFFACKQAEPAGNYEEVLLRSIVDNIYQNFRNG